MALTSPSVKRESRLTSERLLVKFGVPRGLYGLLALDGIDSL